MAETPDVAWVSYRHCTYRHSTYTAPAWCGHAVRAAWCGHAVSAAWRVRGVRAAWCGRAAHWEQKQPRSLAPCCSDPAVPRRRDAEAKRGEANSIYRGRGGETKNNADLRIPLLPLNKRNVAHSDRGTQYTGGGRGETHGNIGSYKPLLLQATNN